MWSFSETFGSRDLDFRFSRPFLHTDVNFQVNLTSLRFRGVGYGRGHFPEFLGLGTLIFDFLVHFYILVPIFVAIRAFFVFSSFSSSSLSSKNFQDWILTVPSR